jgi:hypothetical protein
MWPLSDFCHFIINADYISPLASTIQILNHLMCDKVAFPCSGEAFTDHDILKKDCCSEKCEQCIAFSCSSACFLNCPTMFSEDKQYVWKAYMSVLRDNGSTGTELREVTGNGRELKAVVVVHLSALVSLEFILMIQLLLINHDCS